MPAFLRRLFSLVLAAVGRTGLAGLAALMLTAQPGAAGEPGARVLVGAARVDITPELPIRLSGYQGGARQNEATSVERRLFARALAIGADGEAPAVLITAEVIGISSEISDAVARALRDSHGIERARVALCTTHTHTGPSIRGVLPFMFAEDLPPEHAARIDRYTAMLQEKLIRVATQALAERKPAALAWTEGKAGFAAQRRRIVNGKHAGFGVVADGMVDHALPVLRVSDAQGAVRAVFTSYACHCTTLRGGDNFVHSDWAGEAAAQIESAHEGAVVLVAIGCGADANPNPRTGPADAQRHGAEIAREVKRVLAGALRPVGRVTAAGFRTLALPLDHAVTRAELDARLKHEAQVIRYTASKFVAQLERGQLLPTSVPYPVQTWSFGDELAMVFLGGEVVSEYSLRLRRELGPGRLWVNAYANSVPCYIPSYRMFAEGGYEVDVSMNYYGWPTQLSERVEDLIVSTVHELLPPRFRRPQPAPVNPGEAR